MRPENPPQGIIKELTSHYVSPEEKAIIIGNNLRFLTVADTDNLTKTIRKGVTTNDYRPFVFFEEPDLIAQLQNYYECFTSNSQIQAKLKGVSVKLIEGWCHSEEGYWAIEEYALLSAYWQAPETIPGLIAATGELVPVCNSCSSAKKALTQVLAVLAGFTPNQAVFSAFEEWFQDHHFPWQNKAQITIGLISCQPSNWKKYLLELSKFEEEHPGYFRWDYLGSILSETLSTEELATIINQLPEKVRIDYQKGITV